MSKPKRGLTVGRDVGDPMRRPRPVSQEGYYYPEEHFNDDKNSLHPNSRRQPMRQYGSSASLEVRHEQNRRQREQEFFTSPSVIPKQASFENSRNTPAMQSSFHNADPSVYFQQPARQINEYQSRTPKNISPGEIPRSIPNSNSPSNSHSINTYNTRLNPNQNSYHPNSPGFLASQPHLSNNSHAPSLQHQISSQNHYSNSTSQGSLQQPIRNNLQRPSQEPLTDPSPSNSRSTEQYHNLHIPPGHRDRSQQQYHYSSRNQSRTREAPIVDRNQSRTREAPIIDRNQSRTREAPIIDRNQSRTREAPIIDRNQSRTREAPMIDRNQNRTREAPVVDPIIDRNQNRTREAPSVGPIVDSNKTQRLNLSDPVAIEDYISQAIKYHEDDQLEKSTEYLRIAAEKGSAVGKVLYGIALRHGWGCKVNEALAFNHLQQAAESAMTILNGINRTVSMSAFRGELVLAIYELGVCFRHGWGVPKSKATAAHYFEIAANMGDPDAQNDIAFCYYEGEGVKKDKKKAAKYYRMADAQGQGTMGNSWIYKEKYNTDK